MPLLSPQELRQARFRQRMSEWFAARLTASLASKVPLKEIHRLPPEFHPVAIRAQKRRARWEALKKFVPVRVQKMFRLLWERTKLKVLGATWRICLKSSSFSLRRTGRTKD